MKITICGSLVFSNEMTDIALKLKKLGHEATLPFTTNEIAAGRVSLDDIKRQKEAGTLHEYAIKIDAIRRHYKEIAASDAILVLNLDRKGVRNYIGPNTFLEMGFAHVLGKKIFVLNDLPESPYLEEINVMRPAILNGDLRRI